MRLAGELGNGQGETGGRNGQKNVVDVVCHIEIGLSLGTDNVPEGNFIHCAQNLDNGHRRR